MFSYIPNPFCVTALFPEYLSPPHHFHVCILRIVAISLRSHLHSVSTSSFKRMLILYFTVDFPILKRPLSNGKRNILQELSWILAEEYVFVWSRSFHHWEQSSRITYNYSSYLQHTVIHVERENDFTLHSSNTLCVFDIFVTWLAHLKSRNRKYPTRLNVNKWKVLFKWSV